ncbi:hypothetical protein [Streptomyces sp. NRRL S-1813]|uniref:hypothetical protein n=1 Tax=Streptomyces sp. NRRL S-1813 TaxID=1463888 RepID=UPI0018FEADC4|nr:hypothetical protein [Streptomyces sp. NRRL S-1813]
MVDEQRVRGAVERRYRLRRDRMVIGPEAGASMSLDDHRRGFAAAMAALLAEFNAYLDRQEPTRSPTLWATGRAPSGSGPTNSPR